jgi:hypothetical protein
MCRTAHCGSTLLCADHHHHHHHIQTSTNISNIAFTTPCHPSTAQDRLM